MFLCHSCVLNNYKSLLLFEVTTHVWCWKYRQKMTDITDLSSLTHLSWDSRIWDPSHTLTPAAWNLTRSPAVMFPFFDNFCYDSIPLHLKLQCLTRQTKVTQNCYHQMRFVGLQRHRNALAAGAPVHPGPHPPIVEAYSAPAQTSLAGLREPLRSGRRKGREGRVRGGKGNLTHYSFAILVTNLWALDG